MSRMLLGLVLALLIDTVQAQDPDPLAALQVRLAQVDAATRGSDAAARERLQAQQALQALQMARERDRAFALELAELRVATAETALAVTQLRQHSMQLDRERDAILLEASRRDAELARKEAERLRLQALAREEEENLRDAQAAEAAESAAAGAVLAAQDNALARLEEELAALAHADGEDLRSLGKGRYRLAGTAFQAGKAVLQAEARQSLMQLGRRLRTSGKSWSIEGFSDNLGAEDANINLSRQRAEAVAAALKAGGMPGSKLQVKAWGSSKPLAPNAGKSGRAQNRRVEIIQK